jgi:aryl-alcohol dehydrogenase-like predicted oxidoreductase
MSLSIQSLPAHAAGTFQIAGKHVHRLGFGAMRLTGDGVWGDPADRDEAIAVVRRAVELGVDFIDTADSYGPYVSEEILREALRPVPEHVVIATKAGLVRTGPGHWYPVGRPEYLRQEAELSLRRLGVERLDLFQLHRIDAKVPFEEQIGLLKDLQSEGKIGAIGLSEVSVAELQAAEQIVHIDSVQNRYNITDRGSEDVLNYATEHGVAFIPWYPIGSGQLGRGTNVVGEIAAAHHATEAQVLLAWLLAKSPVVLPIPGTSKVAHVEENIAAAQLQLSDDDVAALNSVA